MHQGAIIQFALALYFRPDPLPPALGQEYRNTSGRNYAPAKKLPQRRGTFI
jgi:hypothetical protein